MAECVITGSLKDLTGADVNNGVILFQRADDIYLYDGSIRRPEVVCSNTDAVGNVSLSLVPGEYTVTVGGGAYPKQFSIIVPELASADIADLISPTPGEVTAITPLVAQAAVHANSASSSAFAAATSAQAASASATAASGSATSAAGAVTAAQNAASTAAASAASVTASAAAAATSATNAANSAAAASASQSSASASAAAAAASQDSADSSANAAASAESAAAASASLAAQKAVEASQFRDEASDAAAAASVAADRVSLGDLDDATASARADAIAAASSAAASSASALQAETSRIAAAASATSASAASSAAFVNANAFADIATGRAAVADGQQFQVVTGDEIIRYRRDSSTTHTEVARYPTGQSVLAVEAALGQIATILGQTYEEVERLSLAQEGDVYTLRTLLEALSLIGQLADQINGGQVALRGGSLADPALRIGTAGIYSSAADTLSVAIAGVERLRVTASGITVYGTVTEA